MIEPEVTRKFTNELDLSKQNMVKNIDYQSGLGKNLEDKSNMTDESKHINHPRCIKLSKLSTKIVCNVHYICTVVQQNLQSTSIPIGSSSVQGCPLNAIYINSGSSG
jgi:hypothetical protein